MLCTVPVGALQLGLEQASVTALALQSAAQNEGPLPLGSLGLAAELPVVLEAGSKGAAGLRSSWPAGGRARHISVKQYFLRDLKEAGILRIIHKAGELAAGGAFAGSTPKDISGRHGRKLYGEDKYYKEFVASKVKKDVAALAKVDAWKGIAENVLPPLKLGRALLQVKERKGAAESPR